MSHKDPLVEKYVGLAATDGEAFVERIAQLPGASYGPAREAAKQALQVFRALTPAELEQLRGSAERAREKDPRRGRRRIAEFFGFPIFLHWSVCFWFILAPLVRTEEASTSASGAAFVAALLFSVTFHEFAHAITCRKLGLGTGTITLTALGGYFIPVSIDRLPFQLERAQRLRFAATAAAGPLSTLLLAGILALVAQATHSAFAATIARLNLSLAALNLLPIPPLDGGSIVMSLSSLYVDWRLLYRLQGGLCMLLAAADLWRANATAPGQQHYAGLFLMFGFSAFAASFRSEAVLLEKWQQGVRAERRLVHLA